MLEKTELYLVALCTTLKKGLSERGAAGLGKVLAVLFAIFCIGGSFGGGNMFQSNQAAIIFNSTAGFTGGASGLIFGISNGCLCRFCYHWWS